MKYSAFGVASLISQPLFSGYFKPGYVLERRTCLSAGACLISLAAL